MKNLKILHIEDDPLDAGLVVWELKKAKIAFDHVVVNTREIFIKKLEVFSPDIILSDHSLPTFNSIEALRIVKQKGIKIPFILVTGNTSEDFAVSVIKEGADDYILKDRMQRLPVAVKNAIEKIESEKARIRIEKEKAENDKAAINELKRLAERLKLAASGSGIGIWDWDIANNHLLWDEEMCKLYGIKALNNVFLYNDWLSFLHPDDKDMVDENIQLALLGEKEYDTEFRIIYNDGPTRYIKARGSVEGDGKGNPVRMLGANWDITGRKELETEKEKTTNDIINRNKALEQFSYIISHNLRSQISNILGITDILKNDKVSEKEQTFLLNGLHTSTEKLDGVIRDVNDILQINKDALEKKEEIYFSDFVSDVKAILFEQIASTQTEIKENFNEVQKIFSIKVYLASIFLNLISNSIKYRQKDIKPVIEIKSYTRPGLIGLVFKDNGIGIDLLKHSVNIFGLYKRFNTQVEGKGIGLYIVKAQVEALGGKISIQSEVNKGTMFEIEIPL